MQTRSTRREELLKNFIEVIKVQSRYEACHETEDNLKRYLGYKASNSMIQYILAEARTAGLVETVSKRCDRPDGTYYMFRVIYLVSTASVEEGALMLSTLIRDRGETVEDTELARLRLCGQLQCTPGQLQSWDEFAQAQGWISYSESKWRHGTTVFKRVDIPGRRFIHGEIGKLEPIKDRPVPVFTREQPAHVIVENWLKSKGVASLTLPYSKIAEAVQLPVKTVTKAIASLAKREKPVLTVEKVGKLNRLTIVGAVDELAESLAREARIGPRNDVQTPTPTQVASPVVEAPAGATAISPDFVQSRSYPLYKKITDEVPAAASMSHRWFAAQMLNEIRSNGWTVDQALVQTAQEYGVQLPI